MVISRDVALPRHAHLEALPPVREQGLIFAYFTCHGFNSSPERDAAEPPRMRDAAEPRHEDSGPLPLARGGLGWGPLPPG